MGDPICINGYVMYFGRTNKDIVRRQRLKGDVLEGFLE
jgi:hypothetical protein